MPRHYGHYLFLGLRDASDEVARSFFKETNLEFQRDVPEPIVARLIPDGRALAVPSAWERVHVEPVGHGELADADAVLLNGSVEVYPDAANYYPRIDKAFIVERFAGY